MYVRLWVCVSHVCACVKKDNESEMRVGLGVCVDALCKMLINVNGCEMNKRPNDEIISLLKYNQ